MIAFRQELLCEVVQEAQPLLEAHHAELNGDRMLLDPRWQDYALLEQLGRYAVFTARDDGRLVGYSAFYVNRHMHSAQFTNAQNDVFYVDPAKRSGMLPARFLRYTHDQLKAIGAQRVGYLCKLTNNLRAILHRLGFEDDEIAVGKMI